MDAFSELLRDNTTVTGRLVTTIVIVIAAVVSGTAAGRLAGWRLGEPYTALDHLWEELTLTISYRDDWRLAETILREEAQRASSSPGAQQAITQTRHRYPVGRTEVQPRVFVRATDNWIELSARFVVPVREARAVKDAVTRTVLDRLAEASIPVASTTQDVTVRPAGTAEDV
jgi:small-conductance mechanosensitive channel